MFAEKFPVVTRLLPMRSKRRSGQPLNPGVRFLVAHDTGNPGSSAAANVRYFANSADQESVSAHLFVDDKVIIECVPALTATPEKAWHVRYLVDSDDRLFGHDANDAAIGVELCYGDRIDPDEAYRRYVWVLACLCDRYALDPATKIVGHWFLDPGRKTDPLNGLAAGRRTWEQLLRDVAGELDLCRGVPASGSTEATQAENGTFTTAVRLNLRQGSPNTRAPVARVAEAGESLAYVGFTRQGEAVNGNPLWYIDRNGHWFWGGGVS